MTGSGADPENGPLTFAWSAGSGSPVPNPANQAVTTVTLGVGTYSYTLTVTDDKGASASATTTVIVNPAPNQPPVVNISPAVPVTLPAAANLSATVTDDGKVQPSPTLSWSMVSGPGSVTFGTPTASTTTAAFSAAGTYLLKLAAFDGELTGSATATITVNRADNHPPTLDAIGPKTVAENSLLSFTVSGSDLDNDPLAFSAAGLPVGASFIGRTFSWTPNYDQAGSYQVTFGVTDNMSQAATETVTITVTNTNRPPTLNPIADQFGREGQPLTFSASGSDPDGDTLNYSARNLPTGATLNPATGLFSWTPSFTQAGRYSIVLVVADRESGAERLFAEQAITIDIADVNRPPVITTTSLPAPKIDYPYSGRIDAYDPDAGDTITFSLALSGVAPSKPVAIDPVTGALSWIPVSADMGKSFSLKVTVSDSKQATATADYTLAVTDTIPPVVTVNAPKTVIPGQQYKVSAIADDNIGVTSFKLSVSGSETVCAVAGDCTVTATVEQSAVPGSTIAVTATALDQALNTGTGSAVVTVGTMPDTTPPTVSLTAPKEGVAGRVVALAATAADNEGVSELVFKRTDRIPPDDFIDKISPLLPGISYTIPATEPVGTVIPLSVTAYDAARNEATATASITVVEPPQTPDSTLPTITLTAPQTVLTGGKLAVTLQVTDDRQVATVELYLAHRKVATFTTAIDPSRVIELPLPDGAEAGMQLVTEVKAVDTSGNSAVASALSFVVAPEIRQGVLTGAVYDDSTGLPLEGAAVTMSMAGRANLQATTDSRGRYSFEADEVVDAVVYVTKTGYNRVERPNLSVVVNRGNRVADARLTPVLVKGTPVSAMLGGVISTGFTLQRAGFSSALTLAGMTPPQDGTISVTFPSGAVTSDAEATLTQIGAQGLQGRRLPKGWSPIAAFRLELNVPNILLNAPADLAVTNLLGSAAPAALITYWDEPTAAWIVAGPAVISDDKTLTSGKLPVFGHYALVVPDPGVSLPQPGEQLPAAASKPLPQSLQTLVSPEPRIAFYKPGVKSNVGFRITANEALTSGTVVWASIAEDYAFFSGERITVEPYAQEIVLYGYGQGTNTLSADFQVSPGQPFNGLELEKGIITVSAVVPLGDNANLFSVVGPQGGTINADTGETVVFPPGAVPRLIPVFLKGFNPAESGISLPAGFSLAGGVTLSAAGAAIAKPLSLSIPLPAGFVEGGDLLVVMPVENSGATRFAVVAGAAVQAGRIVSSLAVPGSAGTGFPGILGDGRILVLQSSAQLAYAGGVVAGTDGQPFNGALITSESLPLVAFSAKSGGYLSTVMPGQFSLTALDTGTMNKGTTAGTVAAAAFAPADISMKIEPPTVVAVSPVAGATGVPLADPVRITLSEPVVAGSVTSANVTVSSSQGVMTGSLELSSDARTITFRHPEPFASNTAYSISVKALVDRSGTPMAQAGFSSAFTSLNTAPPPAPPAGSVTASVPGSDGRTTVTGTQGTAGIHDTVVIVNLTTGERNPVVLEQNGGFSSTVKASTKDQLQLEITGQSGTTTTVQLPRFRQVNTDGSVSEVVGSEGGTVKGPEGIELSIPAEAFPEPAVVTVKPVSEADFPVQLTDEARQVYSFAAGVDLDFGGATPTKYIDVSIPPKGGETRLDQWVLSQVTYDDGLPSLNVVDTAHYFGDRIATSSPPCPGVTGKGVYGFLRSSRPVGISYGQFYNAIYGGIVAQVQSVSDFFMMLPTLVSINTTVVNSQIFCLPILSGRVNVIPNSHLLTIRSIDINANDKEIIVNNTTLNSEQRFPRNILEMNYEMEGKGTDNFEVELGGGSGSSSLFTFFKVYETTTPGKVNIRFSLERYSDKVTQVKISNKSKNPVVQKVFPIADVPVSFTVEGSVSDSLTVALVDYNGVQRSFTGFTRTSLTTASGSGNLMLRVQTGTIDPTQAEIDAYNADHPTTPITGAAVTELKLSMSTGGSIPIDLNELKQGGLAVSFNGDPTATFYLMVKYADGKVDSVAIPRFRIIVKNPQTGKVVKTIEDHSPMRGEPLSLGVIGNASSNDPPYLTMIPSRFKDYDPSVPISFTFSQEVDQSTVKSGLVITMFDETGGTATVTGTLSYSNGGKTVTFIPDYNLKLGTRYKIELKGVKNKTGKVMPDQLFYMVTLKPKRICPASGPADCEKTISIGNDGRKLESLYDVAFTRKRIAGQLKTTVFATGSDQQGYRLLTFDVSDPQVPTEIGHAYGGYYKRRLSLLEGVSFDSREAPTSNLCGIAAGTTRFTGDLIAVNSSNLQSGYVSFFDVTDPHNPCFFGNKLLTTNPESLLTYDPGNASSYELHQGTIRTQANATGIATLRHSTGIAAYAAFTGAGLMAMDIGKNIPEYNPGFRVKEGLFSGDFQDVVNYRDTLLAVDSSNNTLYRLDPNLTQIASLSLGDYSPRRLVAAEVVYDRNKNRLFEPDEFIDVAFVAGSNLAAGTSGITKVNISDQSTLTPFSGIITMPGIARELEYDKAGSRLFVGTLNTLYLLDVSNPDQSATVTNTLTQSSPLMWKADFPMGIRGIKFDSDRGLAYIAVQKPNYTSAGGLDIWSFNGVCSDLSVMMTRKSEELRAKAELLEMEREALRKGITAAMNKLQSPTSDGGCGISGPPFGNGITILEQGSGACIWKKGDTCRNFQPQISDHDFEVFVPSTLWPKSSCIANVLKDQFIDKNTDSPVKFELSKGSVEFDDITFFAFPKEEFETAKPNVRSPAPAGSDAVGDAGLGRRQLLLKWVLEGAYVVPATSDMEPGPDGVRGTPDDVNPLAGKKLAEIRTLLATNKIPLLEGYEQALLQQFNLVKSKAFVRLIGASSPESVLHNIFQKQLHDAAKAGIRSALGRLISVSTDNSAVLSVTRDEFEASACIEDPAKPEAAWKYGPCDSFEHFIASMAARRKPALFTTSELADVAKFYRIKSDLETITSETDANNFILKAHTFIEQSATSTFTVYSNDIAADPDATERQQNATTIGNESSGLLADKLKNAKIHVVPNFNNQGFMEGTNLMISMYEGTTAGSGTLKKTITATLSGGDYRSADYVRTGYFGGQILLSSGSKQPLFQVGPVDMTDTSAQQKGITFTIDLPTTGYQKVLKEAYLQNNYDGFYYYVLPRNALAGSFTPPAVTGKPPLPLPDPSGTLLKADPFCQESASDLEFYMTANGAKQVTVGVDKEVTLGYRVRNVGTKTIKNIKVVRNGAAVMSVASLAPGDEQMNSESFTPTEATQYGLFASAVGEVQNSNGDPEYSAGPKIASVVIDANDLNEPFTFKLYDASKLNDNAHPLSRWLLMHDSSAHDKEIVGAVTDGDDTGGGARIKIEIEGLNTSKNATVTLQDGDLDSVTDGVGTIYSGSFVKNQYTVNVTPDTLGKATVYYTPPGFFERSAYKKEDTGWPASYFKSERTVRVRVKQTDIGRSTKWIKLRRPPVMLVHGLWGNRTVWKDFQPLVPESGVGDYYKPVKGFDGRFDLFAVGTPGASESYEKLSAQLVSEFKYAISDYLPGFSIGKFDVVAHSLGGVLTRRLTSRADFPEMKDSVRKLISNASPFKGSEIANELVAIRAKNVIKRPEFQDLGKMVDFANSNITVANKPGFTPGGLAAASVDFCSLAINALGFANAYNTSRGALDDLQTTSLESQITSFKVPTHTITGTTMGPPIVEGVSLEVQAAWTALTSLCKLTADQDTKALAAWKKSRNDIIMALLTFGRGAAGASVYKVGNNAARALNKASLKLLEDLGKSEFEQVFDEEPKPVFGTSPNDRIVKTDSQMGGLSRSGYAYTDVYGKTDHQQLKIAKGAIWQSCVGVDTALNVPILKNTGISPGDINGDGSPDVGCRVVELLEADPVGKLFIRRP